MALAMMLHTSDIAHIHPEGLLAVLTMAAVLVGMTWRFRTERR